MLPTNPFIVGAPVRGADFLDRRQALRRLASQINHGGSAVVTGEPRMGKTSVLLHLRDAAKTWFDAQAGHMLFHYLDGQTMAGWDADRFWQEAFRPLARRWRAAAGQVYASGRFETVAWEPVFAALERRERRFVLLLDEFDALQDVPALHTRAVYSMLRSLASRYRSFSVVLAARRSLTDMNHAARNFASGSPYFNFALEVRLQPLPEREVKALLDRGRERFTPADRNFLRRIAGRHPFFLQTAAYSLWDAYEGAADDPNARYQDAMDDLFEMGKSVLADIWASWTPYMQMAFTLVALDNAPEIVEGRTFDEQALLRDLPDFSPELGKLARRGFVRPDDKMASGYTLCAEVMLWYLADELTRALRDERSLTEWLGSQQWEGLLKQGEKDAFKRFLRQAAPLLKEGARAFITAAAEGAARGLTS